LRYGVRGAEEPFVEERNLQLSVT
jgi:14-3-3 protein epsilon